MATIKLAECFPAQHRRSVGQQNLPHVGPRTLVQKRQAAGLEPCPRSWLARGPGNQPLGDLLRDLFTHGAKQTVLSWEMVVQRAASDLGTVGHLFKGYPGVTPEREELACHRDELGLGLGAMLGLRSVYDRPLRRALCWHGEPPYREIALALRTVCR